MKMDKLLKKYDLQTKISYFDSIIDSWYNGVDSQMYFFYIDMSKEDKLEFIEYLYKKSIDSDNSDFRIDNIIKLTFKLFKMCANPQAFNLVMKK